MSASQTQNHAADLSAMDRMLSPRSIALIGASNTAHRIGGLLFANLKRAFKGPLYPIHPTEQEIMGVQAYASLDDLPEAADLAVVAVAAKMVPEMVEAAAAAGIAGAVVVTSGFAEVGEEGAALQEQLAEISRRTGIRLIGPNCIGYFNMHGGVMANFAITPDSPLPKAGGTALVSQSGGFGSYISLMAMRAGLGVGWFVSTGNEVDCNVSMVCRHLIERPEVKVLLACVETLRDPDIFIETAERAIELDKPIVLLKAGRSEEAARAAMSHTGSITGSADVLYAVCEQYGVHIAETMQEMLDLGLMFETGKRTKGRRLAVLTTSGGAGVLLTDEAAEVGLTVPELPAEEQAALEAVMPPPFFGSMANPLDTTAQIVAHQHAAVGIMEHLGKSPSIDMITCVTWDHTLDFIQALIDGDKGTDKPVSILCTGLVEKVSEAGTPLYLDPSRAVRPLGALARQSLDRPKVVKAPVKDEARIARMRALFESLEGRKVLMEHEGKQLFAEYGIPVTREKLVATPADADAAAAEIGGKVAIKYMSPELMHKSDVGGLRLGLEAGSVQAEAEAMLQDVARGAPHVALSGILVQEMVPARMELTCGIKRDLSFGPIIVVGMGGVLVEVLAEVAMLRPPFDADMARKVVASLCDGRIASARRGLEPAEIDAVVATVMGLGQMALELPEISEVDVNPVRIANGRAVAADALVILEGAEDAGHH
ncbi:putative acyl-CoA synthetase [Caenibius tardaugens NBRC 16725]|uniref:Putative acyl-CoA synthetase n=1 Tax=Caenibius tardaugens NBRC 16725 TaxID=1219035 RepID=U2ZYY8_9SPHN|nr:acetate--CoA ligase family protein [Caenibius tardaugens]AZI37040.1 CoA-binding protein [Caenibius tardaugens NBRC 16725]GAD47733.1 putative acyl-CoA synthetase [Caenibius tardaugens NBRC 16725]